MAEIPLHDLWRRLKAGDWVGGITDPAGGFLPIWKAWIRAAAQAGYRLVYFHQNGTLAEAFQALPGVARIEAPRWHPGLKSTLRDLLSPDHPLAVGIWEDLGALLNEPDPQEAQEILETLDQIRQEAPVLWFTLIRWEPRIVPLFTPPVPLASLLLLPLISEPDPLLLILQLRSSDLAFEPGYYRMLLDSEPRLEALSAHRPWLRLGLPELFRTLHHLRSHQRTLEERIGLAQSLIQRAGEARDLNGFLEYLIRELVNFLRADRGAITLQEGPDRLRIVAEYRAIEGPSVRGQVIDLARDPLSARVVRTREPIALSAPESMDAFGASAPFIHQLGVQSILITPIVLEERVIGTIGLDYVRAPRPFDHEEIQFIRAIAAQVAHVIERLQALEESQRRARLLAVLHRILQQATEAGDMNSFLKDILPQILEAFGLPVGGIWVEQQIIAHGIDPERLAQILRKVIAQCPFDRTTAIEDLTHFPPFPGQDAIREAGIRAILFAPIGSGSQRVGALVMGSLAPRFWSSPEIAMAEAVAMEISRAIERRWAFRNLRLLYRLADALTSLHLSEAMLVQALEDFRSELDAQSVCAYLREENAPSTLVRMVGVGQPEVFPEHIHLEEIPLLQRVLGGEAVWISNPADLMGMPFPFRTLVVLPLTSDRETLGIFLVAWAAPRSFDADLRHMLTRAAGLLTTGVLNRRLWRQLQAHARELELLSHSLQQALVLREQMIQNVSHELRTPLAVLQGYLELMKEEALGPLTPAQQEALEIMRHRLDILIRYVELLLTLQEIQAGARSLNVLDLRELIRTACRAYQTRLDPQRHRLQVHLPDHPVWVLGEGQPLLLAFSELLENAVKFSPRGGTIQVSLSLQGHEACIQVRDEGIGIPPEALSHVFEPFYQVDGGTTRKFSGMGIGLAAVKQIAEAHQGRVEIESEIGRGTCVTIYLPIVIP